jgi:hypothetical protein
MTETLGLLFADGSVLVLPEGTTLQKPSGRLTKPILVNQSLARALCA